jgi:hypothetical protein
MSYFPNYTTYKIFRYIQTILIVVSRKVMFLCEVTVFSVGECTRVGVPCYCHFRYINAGGFEDT